MSKKQQETIQEYEQAIDLRFRADQRAIKRWQEATGKTYVWPDHADLCVWLIEALDRAEEELSRLRAKR